LPASPSIQPSASVPAKGPVSLTAAESAAGTATGHEVATSSGFATFQGVDYRAIVTIEPGKRGGKPCIRGLRITVYDVLEYLASGMSEAEILADFPDLTSDDIRACLAFAADRERRLLSVPAV
jgi:uncharacterized protein (DUF433 family)